MHSTTGQEDILPDMPLDGRPISMLGTAGRSGNEADVVVTDAARKRALAAKQYIEKLYDDKKSSLRDRKVRYGACRCF